MSDEVSIQIVFPLLNTQRFIRASRKCSIQDILIEIRKLDDFLELCIDTQKPWVFDEKGNLIDKTASLENFGEKMWIQLFVT
ncbi:MAG: hypothetical protein J6K75_07670 [Erysipelotrichaceae bacterium]|nr:hypothetical protein [Erysipelotrichaceae bacterium]